MVSSYFNVSLSQLVHFPLTFLISLYINLKNFTTMIKKSHFKLLAIVMACLLCHSGAYAQEYDDTWTIDGVEYAWSSGEAAVIGCYSQHLVAPPEVNLYRDDGGEYVDRIVPVGNVARNAFEESSLITVDLGPNVTDLNYHCFYNCNSMTDIVCRSTIPPYVNYAFSSSMYSRVKVHVPASAYNTYKAHAEWKKFTNIVVIDSEWGVDINSTNFPDANFRSYLLTQYPKGYLTRQDIQNCTTLELGSKSISDAKGIEFFTELQMLNLFNNGVTTINLSQNTKLTYLNMGYNQLTSINLSANTAMERLFLQHNRLTTVTVTGRNLTDLWVKDNTLLTKLYCFSNNLTQLSVSGCTALEDLRCYNNNNLTAISGLGDCTAITYLDCRDCAITDLSAVSGLNSLATLLASNNKITTLDVRGKSSLTRLDCYNNPRLTTINCQNCSLTTFDCHGCTALKTLHCWNNQFSTFNVTGNTALTELDCGPCRTLSSITGLASCTAMEVLICYSNAMTELSDAISNMNNLVRLNCDETQIRNLTVQNKSKLTQLSCNVCPQLLWIDINYNENLTSLYCLNCPTLQLIGCSHNNLPSLDVSGNTALTALNCYYNPNLSNITSLSSCTNLIQLQVNNCNFSTLDVSNFTKLQELRCHDNKLTSLNVSGKTKLTILFCDNNQLNSLNVQNCNALADLDCRDNQLRTLNVQGCNALRDMYCSGNSITESGMTTLINSMPTISSPKTGNFHVLTRFDENNVLTSEHITNARNKNWIPYMWTGTEYIELSATMPGDANGDGIINISDVTGMLNAVMSENFDNINSSNADMNNDGIINITDVTLLINHLMSL